jgi:hypothetical protein
MPNWELYGISSFYIYVLILHQTEDRPDGLAKPAKNITRRKQSIANSATPNMPALQLLVKALQQWSRRP